MRITPIRETLAGEGLREPELSALTANVNNYTVLLLQPHGEIETSVNGVRNRNREHASIQFEQFLVQACNMKANLVITPEYSMPWDTLVAAIKNGKVPEYGNLWALGCESIRYNELENLKAELRELAAVLFEPLALDANRFLDPLVYVFVARSIRDSSQLKLVLLVQFKTFPSGDPGHFEIDRLQQGSLIYQFGGNAHGIKLVSMICSDALDFRDEDARAIYERGLIIHIQLNPKPCHHQYRQYRDRLFNRPVAKLPVNLC